MDDRKEFLMKIYDQMFNDIDRHHKIVWQTMGILVGAFAVLALVEKNIISTDIASGLIILIASWVLAHVYDSNYWYNRNLIIIANIERQFLVQNDLKEIHYYFGAHRDKNSVQTSLRIQRFFCWAIIVVFLIYHFSESIFPGFQSQFILENLRPEKIIPYVALLGGLLFVRWIKNKRIKNYEEFLAQSPGKAVNTIGISYGDGHPTS